MGIQKLGVIAVIAVALAGCGQPTQKYGASKSEGVYFTVPIGWKEISTSQLNTQEAKSTAAAVAARLTLVKWQVAYSQGGNLSATDAFSLKAPTTPLAFARVRALFLEEANAMSYDLLRDIVWPITEWVNNPTSNTPIYNIIDDHEVIQRGGRGVRTIFSVVQSGVSQTIDQTSLMSEDHRRIYVFIVRCTSVCYNKNLKTISRIADSFTVRGAK